MGFPSFYSSFITLIFFYSFSFCLLLYISLNINSLMLFGKQRRVESTQTRSNQTKDQTLPKSIYKLSDQKWLRNSLSKEDRLSNTLLSHKELNQYDHTILCRVALSQSQSNKWNWLQQWHTVSNRKKKLFRPQSIQSKSQSLPEK